MGVIGHDLFQVYHPLRPCGANHRFAVDSHRPESRLVTQLGAELLKPVLRVAAAKVHCVHPSARCPTERGVFEIVVEDDDVAMCYLQNNGWDFTSVQPPNSSALPDIAFNGVGISLPDAVAARDDAQCPGVACQRVEVEGNLDAQDAIPVISIGVPVRVAGIEVAVAARVIEVVAADAGGDVMDAWVVQ